jgi:peptidoglycan/xylan/chitin deacetylase (PgdA/CDA1 family)
MKALNKIWSSGTARPAGAVILMYHSVAQDDEAKFIEPPNRIAPRLFERQMAFLREHRRAVPLSRLVDAIADGTSLPAGTVCITFDDGYRDNLTTAAPILERYGLPATLFLATGHVERAETQWSDTLHWLFRCATQHRLSLPVLGPGPLNLAARAEKARAHRLLHAHLLEAEHEERAALLREIERQLAPAVMPPRLMLDWDEVRELRRRFPFFEIGGHTRSHIDLAAHPGATARAEIEGCGADLARELGGKARHFSYPYGRWCAQTRAAVIAAGWRAAVATDAGGGSGPATDRYAMPRVEAPRSMTQLAFKTSSGAYPEILSMLGIA